MEKSVTKFVQLTLFLAVLNLEFTLCANYLPPRKLQRSPRLVETPLSTNDHNQGLEDQTKQVRFVTPIPVSTNGRSEFLEDLTNRVRFEPPRRSICTPEYTPESLPYSYTASPVSNSPISEKYLPRNFDRSQSIDYNNPPQLSYKFTPPPNVSKKHKSKRHRKKTDEGTAIIPPPLIKPLTASSIKKQQDINLQAKLAAIKYMAQARKSGNPLGFQPPYSLGLHQYLPHINPDT